MGGSFHAKEDLDKLFKNSLEIDSLFYLQLRCEIDVDAVWNGLEGIQDVSVVENVRHDYGVASRHDDVLDQVEVYVLIQFDFCEILCGSHAVVRKDHRVHLGHNETS